MRRGNASSRDFRWLLRVARARARARNLRRIAAVPICLTLRRVFGRRDARPRTAKREPHLASSGMQFRFGRPRVNAKLPRRSPRPSAFLFLLYRATSSPPLRDDDETRDVSREESSSSEFPRLSACPRSPA